MFVLAGMGVNSMFVFAGMGVNSMFVFGGMGVNSMFVFAGMGVNSMFVFAGMGVKSMFVFAGMGVNSMFVMLAAWRGTDVYLPTEERAGLMFADAGMSLAMTTAADFFIIILGAATQHRSLQIFCIYFGISVFFQYIYMVTFFAACVTLYAETEYKNQHGFTCHEVYPLSHAGRSSPVVLSLFVDY